ncbi:Heterodisulfide reductase subunit C [Candidatus Zixiibacteriota bacterium]|nr:Heterodisulfide reductase subunit C [candidate division Zixibacteria bacterium]
MPDQAGWRKIKYEEELDPGFADEIASIPGGEHLFNCIQCGTCSGMCPLSPEMDYTPRRIIAMIRAGFRQEVLSSYTCWLCASCYSCAVECPKNVKITDIMYAAKRLAIKEGVAPSRFPISVLAREFFNQVHSKGRSTEGRLIMRLYMKSNPFKALKQASLGLKLWTQGRIGVGSEAIKRKGELQRLLQAIEPEHMVRKGEVVTRKEVR